MVVYVVRPVLSGHHAKQLSIMSEETYWGVHSTVDAVYRIARDLIIQKDERFRSTGLQSGRVFPEKFLFRSKEAQFEALVWIIVELFHRNLENEKIRPALARVTFNVAIQCICDNWLSRKKYLAMAKDEINHRRQFYLPGNGNQALWLCQLAYVSSVYSIITALEKDTCSDGSCCYVPRLIDKEDELLSKTSQKQPRELVPYVEKWMEQVRNSDEMKKMEALIAELAPKLAGS